MTTILRFALLLLVLVAVPARAAETATVRFSFLFVCDIYEMAADRDGRGGMALIAGTISAERAKGGHLLVAHGGDTISPSLMSGLDQGAHMIDLLNLVKPDVFVPGNHEYDFGPDVFLKRMGEARFPVLAANLADAEGKPLAGIGDVLWRDFDGLRLAVIGLTADDSPTRSSPGALRFAETVRTATQATAKVRKEGADLVVLVVHARRDEDLTLIAEAGADIILSGDDHDLLVAYDGRTAFVEAMQDGLYVAVVDVEAQVAGEGEKRRVDWHPNFRLLDSRDFAPDPAVAARVAEYEARLGAELDLPLAQTTTELDSRNAAVRGGEAAIGNLFADAVKAATGADIALLNGGGLRGNRIYPPGTTLSRRDVLKELPFGNKTYVLEISGTDLAEALEQAFARAERLTGAFPQVSGLVVRADLSRAPGNRLVSAEVNGLPLDPGRTYRLATNDFLARGGDGLSALSRGRVVVGATDAKLVANQVMAYLAGAGKVSPRIEGRVIVARLAEPQ
jgi:2',3'-cyclic-nucleotide 2'-phosphodiesterase (5'-nucleotidase family)